MTDMKQVSHSDWIGLQDDLGAVLDMINLIDMATRSVRGDEEAAISRGCELAKVLLRTALGRFEQNEAPPNVIRKEMA